MTDHPGLTRSYGWTQPCCDACWDERHPDRPSPRLGQGPHETCVHCAADTVSGIYVRVDPATALYPTLAR